MNLFLSDNEIQEIEKIEVDKNIIDKLKDKNENIFFNVQLKKSLKIVQNTLDNGEEIENYFVGRNYSVDSTRLALAATLSFARLSHPIYGWNTIGVLIRTSKKFILLEMTMAETYSKHYEINNEIHIVKEKNEFYIIVSDNKQKTIIQFNNDLYDILMDCIKDKAVIIMDKKINVKSLKIGKRIGNVFLLYIIIVTIVFAILEIIKFYS